MGGKAQRAQRTKNNARPSSSGRSAELLTNNVKDPVLFGAGPGQHSNAFFPTLATASFDNGLNTDYTLCFKKLNKKDPITKTKALQELHDLLKNGNLDDVVAALPAWAHFYPVLTIDTDRKVREWTQVCHACIVHASGRQLALQLRRLLPTWLLAQSDDFAPAQYHAHASLMNTFPEGKLPEAITFCKAEIIAFLQENLSGKAEGMLLKKFENEEEKNTQIEHIMASSLGALQLFVAQLPPAHDAWLWDSLRPLLRDAAFWKLVQSSTNQNRVRGAWYGVIGRLVERFKTRFGEEYGARAGRALLALPECPPAAVQRWAAFLLLMHNVENWPTWFDKKDLLIKRILDVLENGGWGDAALQSELLLQLLARLPLELVTKEFYEKFFTAAFIGLEKKNVLSSKSGRQAWSKNLAECLRYLSMQQQEFVIECTTSAHRSWLNRVLSFQEGQGKIHLIRHTAANVAVLFKFWLERTIDESNDKFDQLLRTCWQNIGSVITSQINGLSKGDGDVSAIVDGHIVLLQNLKTTLNHDEKKQLRIKFADDPEVAAEVKEAVTKIKCDTNIVDRYMHSLYGIAERTCSLYLEFALRPGATEAVLAPLLALLAEFGKERMYAALARHFGASGAYGLYQRVLRAPLLEDASRCKPLLDLVFLSLKYMNDEEQDHVFHSFEMLEKQGAERCLELCTSQPHCTERAPARWLRGARAQRALLSLCARVLQHCDPDAEALLLRCLTHTVNGENVISEESVGCVVQQVRAALDTPQPDAPQLERRAHAAAQLCSSLAARGSYAAALGTLAAALFALQLQRGEAQLPSDTWAEVCRSWQHALRSLHPAPRQALLKNMVAMLHEKLFENTDKLDETQIENIVALLPYALSASDVGAPRNHVSHHVADFIAQLFAFPEDRSAPAAAAAELCALRTDIIMGNLNCPLDDKNELVKRIIDDSTSTHFKELDREDLIFNAQKWLFKASCLRTFLLRRIGNCDTEEKEVAAENELKGPQVHGCNYILENNYIRDQFLTLLYEHVVLSTLEEGYAFWLGHNIIRRAKLLLDDLIKGIIKEMSANTKQKIHYDLISKSVTIGYYWSYAQRYFNLNAFQKAPLASSGKSIHVEFNDTEKEQIKITEKTEEKETSYIEEEQKVKVGGDLGTYGKEETHEKESSKEYEFLQTMTGSGYFHSMQADLKWRDTRNGDAETRLRCRFAVALRCIQIAHGRDMDTSLFETQWLAGEALIDLNYWFPSLLVLAEREILSAPWAHVVSNAAILDLLDELVCAHGWDLPSHNWDFVAVTLASILDSLALSVANWGCTKVALLCRSALRLFASVRVFTANIRSASEQRRPPEHLLALATEWDDIFAPSINTHLFKMITTILRSGGVGLTYAEASVAGALAAGVAHLQWELLPAEERAQELARARVAAAAAEALRDDPRAPVQLLAYNLLRALAEGLVLDDARTLAQWREVEEGGPRGALSLAQCDAALTHLQELLDAALSDLDVCVSCELVAGSDSERVARAYLLLAVAAYEQYQLARGDLVHHYIEHYRECKYGEYMISCSVRLLPAALAAYAQDDTAATPLPAHLLRYFQTAPEFTLEEICLPEAVGALACRAVMAALAGAGCAGARGWWGAAGARQARAVRRLVTGCVAPLLHRAQLTDLKRRAAALSDPEVEVEHVSVSSGGEARCVLLVEERPLELCVQLSEAHPLVPPRVTADALPAAPNTTHWLTVYLAYQNGSLYDAFRMWIRSVSARLESSPQCYICYCRLHPASGRLPTVHCRQCRNKFHSPCLRKWFTTSNKTNCPLCRSNF